MQASHRDIRGHAEREVAIPAGQVTLTGDLAIPSGAGGLVLFAHGSGSSRHSPRNQSVAAALQQAGIATLLFDLLTRAEEIEEQDTRHLRFDIGLISQRLEQATSFVRRDPSTRSLSLGYFGASTGAAAALVASAHLPGSIVAIVSRGGRPDLAGPVLPRVTSPTLLIVGGEDGIVVDLNQDAFAQLKCEKRLEVVPGATHLFEEPGALERVTSLAIEWFAAHLGSSRS